MLNKKLYIVIVNFKSKEYLKKCLDSLIPATKYNKSKGLNTEVVIIENGSGEKENLVSLNTKYSFTFINSDNNLGFSAGNNLGLNYIKKKNDYDYVLLLNPDTIVEENALFGMVAYMEQHKKVGLSTCYVEMVAEKGIDKASHRGFPTPWASFCYYSKISKLLPNIKLFSGYHMTYKDMSTVHEIDSPVGAFFLLSKDCFDKVGLLDEDYFMYGEDLDYAYRVKEYGYKVIYNPNFSIYHYKGVSSGIKKHSSHISKNNLETKIKVTKSFYETMKIFYSKHYAEKYPKLITWLVYKGIDFKMKKSVKNLKV